MLMQPMKYRFVSNSTTYSSLLTTSLCLFLVGKVFEEATIERTRTFDMETKLFFQNFNKMILAAGKRSSEDIGPKEKPTFRFDALWKDSSII